MPEIEFSIRWPDGSEELCYSPSTVLREFFRPGAEYSIADFLKRCRSGLGMASQRVEAKFGFRCTSADAQLKRLETVAARYKPEEIVRCLSIS
ncbi:MSMEG_0570 family nitrogen starvation response protein [Algicella marina]|uniref:MSMEG_0570 family nitrogen starvation response protein n=1 Tax=Algicella marina TaxID=2683284 RepID=A0A6P1SYB7_9RHOB|nr:MSMEG_0570 family nitrogen starvation response protein [Algicella marina]QHQ34353.1 MSMEG_0570 family nitrogen starvation response protein [Algicella marina]